MNTLFDLPPVQKLAKQKQLPVWRMIYVELLKGGSVEIYGSRMKVRDARRSPVRIVARQSIRPIKNYIKPDKKNNAFVLDRRYVRSLSKRYWVKKMYLIFLRKKQTDGLR